MPLLQGEGEPAVALEPVLPAAHTEVVQVQAQALGEGLEWVAQPVDLEEAARVVPEQTLWAATVVAAHREENGSATG